MRDEPSRKQQPSQPEPKGSAPSVPSNGGPELSDMGRAEAEPRFGLWVSDGPEDGLPLGPWDEPDIECQACGGDCHA